MDNEGIGSKIRHAAFAGMFYPDAPEELRRVLEDMFESVEEERVSERVLGLIAPHAGYVYSGSVAAEAYNQIKGNKYEAVIVVAPSHREYFQGFTIYDGDMYETPLGKIKIDKELAEICVESNENTYFSEKGHRQEHSLEVQLPFLQFALEEFALVPIVMGEQGFNSSTGLGMALSKILKERDVLIVASSDLSHFYDSETAFKLDSRVVSRVNNLDHNGLSRDLEEKKSEACGMGPMIAVMYASKLAGAKFSKVLKYKNSGDVTGDKREVVGYLSAVMYGD